MNYMTYRKSIMIIALAMSVLFVVPSMVYGEVVVSSADNDRISNRYAKAAAYYRVVSFANKSTGNFEEMKRYQAADFVATSYALAFAIDGRNNGDALYVVMSRIQVHQKMMMKEIGHDYNNVSIIMHAYQTDCDKLINSPSDYVRVYMESHQENLKEIYGYVKNNY